MCFSSPKVNTSAADAAQQQADQAAATRASNISTGEGQINDLFSQYNDPYYQGLTQNYDNYYQPQLDKQYSDAQQQQLYSLANNGNLDSSAAQKASSDLAKEYAQNEQSVLSGGEDYANTAKQSVQNVRSNLTNQLLSTGDNSGINSAALNQIQVQNVQSLAPLANLFTNAVNSVSTANNSGALGSLFGVGTNTTSGGNTGSSGKVVYS